MQVKAEAGMFGSGSRLLAVQPAQRPIHAVRHNFSALAQYMFIPKAARQWASGEHETARNAISAAAVVQVTDVARPDSSLAARPASPPQTDARSPQEHGQATFIRQLDIQDFALISRQRVMLQPGLNVLTGESGAGKSVLVQALAAVLGAPAAEGSVRLPAEFATVEGVMQLSSSAQMAAMRLMESLGVPRKAVPAAAGAESVGTELRIRREIRQDGGMLRSRCFVNGAATSLRVLRELAAELVDVNGQHSVQSLRDSDTQLALLDRIAGTQPAAAEFGGRLRRLRELEAQLAAIDELGDEDERDALQALVDEVRAVGVEEGEERRLRGQLRQMESRRAAVERCGLVRTALGSEGGVADGIATVQGHVQGVLMQEEAAVALSQGDEDEGDEGSDGASEADNEGVQLMEEALDILEQASAMLSEAESKVASYARRYRYSPAEQAEVSERLQALTRLLKQHDCTDSSQLLAAATRAEASLDTWFRMKGQRGDIEAEAAQQRGEAAAAAASLSRRRRAAAAHLRVAVESCLAELAMAGSRFDMRIGWDPCAEGSGLHVEAAQAELASEAGGCAYRVRDSGLDTVEFLLAAGPAEPLRPLAAVASGGESARIMMALKAAPAAAAAATAAAVGNSKGGGEAAVPVLGPPILVLDELDSGVGGRLGQPVAAMLRRMARPQSGAALQILCVSHLPQVAAHADHHLCVRKDISPDGRMLTAVVPLQHDDDRIAEVAAMLGLDTHAAQTMLRDAAEGLSTPGIQHNRPEKLALEA